jgi:hypothetical protein
MNVFGLKLASSFSTRLLAAASERAHLVPMKRARPLVIAPRTILLGELELVLGPVPNATLGQLPIFQHQKDLGASVKAL